MTKRFLPMILSVLVCSLFLTVTLYFAGTKLIENQESFEESNPFGAWADAPISLSEFEALKEKNIPNIKEWAYVESDRSPAFLDGETLVVEKGSVNGIRPKERLLLQGHMPQKPDEISLDESLQAKLGVAVGDRISLAYGQRQLDGEMIPSMSAKTSGESFVQDRQETYTVVGITETYLNRNLGLHSAHVLSQSQAKNLLLFVNFEDIYQAYDSQDALNEALGNLGIGARMIINQGHVGYYGLDKSFVARHMNKGVNIFALVTIVVAFVLIIKNIFSIWGLGKLRELSMYKSVGSTNGQILILLAKEALVISILPVLIGHGLGYVLLKAAYAYTQHRFADVITVPTNLRFNLYLSLGILALSLLVVLLATVKPARDVAKIPIIEGLKGNVALGQQKKKRHPKIWKELAINNRSVFKAQKYISLLGIFLLGGLFLTLALANMNDDFFNKENPYNLRVNYFSEREGIPEQLEAIQDRIRPDKSHIMSEKYVYIPYEDDQFSDAFKAIGFQKGFENFYYPGQALQGALLFYDQVTFEALGGHGDEVLLLNRVQKNVKEKPDVTQTIPYFKDPKALSYQFFQDGKVYPIQVDRELEKLDAFEPFFRYYSVYLITSYDNYGKIMANFDEECAQRGNKDTQKRRYALNMMVDSGQVDGLSRDLEKELKEQLRFDESFNVLNGNVEERRREMDISAVAMIALLIGGVVLLLNLVNAYSSTNLSFMNRQKELGTLRSCGLSQEDLEKRLKGEFLADQGKAVILALGLLLLAMLVTDYFLAYVSFKGILTYYRFDWLALMVGLVVFSNYGIYRVIMKSYTQKNIIDCLK